MGQTASEELVLAAAVDHADATADAVDDGRDRKAEIVQARTKVHRFACVRGSGKSALCAVPYTPAACQDCTSSSCRRCATLSYD